MGDVDSAPTPAQRVKFASELQQHKKPQDIVVSRYYKNIHIRSKIIN